MRYRLRTLLIVLALGPPAIWLMVMSIDSWIVVLGMLGRASRDEWASLLFMPAGLVSLTLVVLLVAAIFRRLPSRP